MIAVSDLEIRIGARTLMSGVNFRIQKGDKVGLVGRNGAGKTTLTKILAGEGQPTAGQLQVSGQIGYLPQDPKTGNLDELAKTRILNARGLGDILQRMQKATEDMGSSDTKTYDAAMKKYARAELEFTTAGGYAAEAEAASIASNLGISEQTAEILDQLTTAQILKIASNNVLMCSLRFDDEHVWKLLANTRVTRWLSHHRQEYLTEFQTIAEIETLSSVKAAAE